MRVQIKFKYISDILDFYIIEHNETHDIVIIKMKDARTPLVSFYLKDNFKFWNYRGLCLSGLTERDELNIIEWLSEYVKFTEKEGMDESYDLNIIRALYGSGHNIMIKKEDLSLIVEMLDL